MKIKSFIAACFILLLCFSAAAQNLKLAELFNEGAVLQRNAKVLVWGTTSPSTSVSVNIQGKQAQSKSDDTGKWSVELRSLNGSSNT